MNKKIKNWKTGSVVLGVLLLSGCASVQIVGKPSSFKSLPSVIVIGDITPADEKVKIPSEEIKTGQEILLGTFKKELPEFTVLENVQNLPAGTENYLLVETKIKIYQEAQLLVMSLMSAEMAVTKYKEKEIIFKFPAAATAGSIWGKTAAYRENLKGMAKELAKTIKKYAGK